MYLIFSDVVSSVLSVLLGWVPPIWPSAGGGVGSLAIGSETCAVQTYVDSTGSFLLRVVPVPKKHGWFHYAMYRGRKPMWISELPIQLSDVIVLASGFVVGCANSSTFVSSHDLAALPSPTEALEMIIIDPEGRNVLRKVVARHPASVLAMPPIDLIPSIRRVFVHEETAEAVFELVGDGVECRELATCWGVYTLKSGERVAIFEPADVARVNASAMRLVSALPITGTPFILVHWYIINRSVESQRRDHRTQSAVFAVLDLRGNLCWKLQLDGDYESLSAASQSEAESYFRSNPAIVVEGLVSGVFSVRSFSKRQLERFHVIPTADGVCRISKATAP